MNTDKELDVRGQKCPMPILLTRRALDGMDEGKVLKVTATDHAAPKDFAAFARKTGNVLLESAQSGGEYLFYIRKQAPACSEEIAGCGQTTQAALASHNCR
ncbi:MAG TPA: sulfurtransferase TusA family protein [Gallionellaceae bacterium]